MPVRISARLKAAARICTRAWKWRWTFTIASSSSAFSPTSRKFPAYSASNASITSDIVLTLKFLPMRTCRAKSRDLFAIAMRPQFARMAFAGAAIFALLAAGGCQRVRSVETKPLDKAGMDFSSIEVVKAMNPSDTEIAEVAKAKMGGLSDKTCIELLRISRGQGQSANFADAADGLVQAGMTEREILDLANMKQLGVGYGKLQAMRLTGLSDAVVMEVARRHAAGKTALAGVSLARLKDTGMSQAALFELVHRGIPDNQVAGM